MSLEILKQQGIIFRQYSLSMENGTLKSDSMQMSQTKVGAAFKYKARKYQKQFGRCSLL